MDWLSSNGAQIDYKGKKVKIRMPNGKEILIKSQRQTHIFLNIAQAKQLLRKDSKAYLAYVAGTKREAPIPDSWSGHINGQVRPMCALDPVVRAMLCALLGCYDKTLCRNDEESGGTPPNHVLYAIRCFIVLLLFARAFQTKVNVLYTQREKSHLPLMHGKETRAYGENCKSLALARDALRAKGIYFNKEHVSENENLRIS
ncbi:hypothetical protein AgCh_034327 [Apium graveolens]